ncbi:hypothetical protein DFQ26_002798, partial [Actinomortierella ambigua]
MCAGSSNLYALAFMTSTTGKGLMYLGISLEDGRWRMLAMLATEMLLALKYSSSGQNETRTRRRCLAEDAFGPAITESGEGRSTAEPEPESDQAEAMLPTRLYVADRFVASSEVEPVQAETYSGDRSLAASERSYNNINVQRGGRELAHPNLPADHFINDYFIRRESLDRQLKLQFMEM